MTPVALGVAVLCAGHRPFSPSAGALPWLGAGRRRWRPLRSGWSLAWGLFSAGGCPFGGAAGFVVGADCPPPLAFLRSPSFIVLLVVRVCFLLFLGLLWGGCPGAAACFGTVRFLVGDVRQRGAECVGVPGGGGGGWAWGVWAGVLCVGGLRVLVGGGWGGAFLVGRPCPARVGCGSVGMLGAGLAVARLGCSGAGLPGCYPDVISMLSRSYLNVISLLSQCYLNVISELSQCYLTVISELSRCYLNVISMLSRCYLNVISMLCLGSTRGGRSFEGAM